MKFYVVRAAYKGEPEFLFSIAERFLKDGERWPEILELNKDRPQADGGRLTDPASITAGWVLVLPADAKGKLVRTGPLPEVSAAPTNPATPAPAPGAAPSEPESATLYWVIGASTLVLGTGLIGYAMIARRRAAAEPEPAPTPPPRRTPPAPRGPASGAPSRLGQSAAPEAPDETPAPRRNFFRRNTTEVLAVRPFDAAGAWTVDRGLRSLSGMAHDARRQVPPFYAVVMDREWMQLRLAAPDFEAPAPWGSDEDGRTWSAPLRALQALPLKDGLASPSPRLVTLGTDSGARVLVDLGQATGVISVEGTVANVHNLLLGWIGELVAAPWAEHVRVVTVGLAPAVSPPASDRAEHFTSLPEAFTAIGWSESGTMSEAVRGGGSVAAPRPAILIVAGRFRDHDLEHLQALASQPDANWTIVIVGRVPAARWRFALRPGGKLDTGVLGITAQVNDSLASPTGIR
ncbi:LysM peptidoglycan-binding domain-containing protein [Kineosporia babensis]|uniref:LysM domain-containing protein n=1 Tax=Kineosporia babensis TaxID=499548 RepID=A0A9X1SVV6_9ACTN|nr:hypothetical protein [Kineosporia babensis]MCD5314397.1 hypothetical protein [Kineosporia babensis]